MKRGVKNITRFALVTVGIVALTSFTIDATDALNGSQSALSILAKKATTPLCPSGTIEISLAHGSYCMDTYENSVGEDCPTKIPEAVVDTKKNLSHDLCRSQSQAHIQPWTQVTFHQAKELCAKRGMRLPSSEEWYEGALGTPVEESCNIRGTLTQTGASEACVSARGMYDMVGNVWEWVDEEVIDGEYRDRMVPEEGYVAEVDRAGVAVVTRDIPSDLYDQDYFWSKDDGSFVMMRGGYYRSQSDAGVYAVHFETAPSFASPAIGFRCVKDL